MARSLFPRFGSIVLVSLLITSSVVALLAPSISAQPPPPAIELSPGQGPVGATFQVGGSGFSGSSGATVTFDGVLQTPSACSEGTFSGTTITTDATGIFVCAFAVPSEIPGSYPVVGEDSATSTPTATEMFTVTTPTIALSPSQGPVGAVYTVGGSGFNALSGAAVSFNGHRQSPAACSEGTPSGTTITTNVMGLFVCSFRVPSEKAGTYPIMAEETPNGAPTPDLLLTVTSPKISMTPDQGPAGAALTVSGAGFSVSHTVANLDFYWATISSCTSGSLSANVSGAFSCTFAVPIGGSERVPVTARDVGGEGASKTFKLTTPKISVSPGQGPVGGTVTVVGTGFSVSTDLMALVFDSATIPSCTSGSLMAGATGSFSCTFPVPVVTTGTTTITAADAGGQSAMRAFKVTTPKITVSPTQGAGGATVTVSGTGFSELSTVGLAFGSLTVSTCPGGGSLMTGGAGSFACTFDVPISSPGTTVINATDLGGQVATARFTVT
jgi:hypothetical protein